MATDKGGKLSWPKKPKKPKATFAQDVSHILGSLCRQFPVFLVSPAQWQSRKGSLQLSRQRAWTAAVWMSQKRFTGRSTFEEVRQNVWPMDAILMQTVLSCQPYPSCYGLSRLDAFHAPVLSHQ
ncbi:unnamed protein product [Polarella glacialis]|uniref:Uncharacterized protein n=1 Tax=Polarella glacialis TaxID=89957 RepID=A0A813E8M3_POLGL|nr:unnamed protein product [Polarella glacialis]